jgi:hypothetical protein
MNKLSVNPTDEVVQLRNLLLTLVWRHFTIMIRSGPSSVSSRLMTICCFAVFHFKPQKPFAKSEDLHRPKRRPVIDGGKLLKLVIGPRSVTQNDRDQISINSNYACTRHQDILKQSLIARTGAAKGRLVQYRDMETSRHRFPSFLGKLFFICVLCIYSSCHHIEYATLNLCKDVSSMCEPAERFRRHRESADWH